MKINIMGKTQSMFDRIIATQLAAINLKPVFQNFGRYYVQKIRKQFDRSVDPYDDSWASLKPATIRAKRRKGQPSKPLIATGRSRRSIRFDPRPNRCFFIFVTRYLWYHDSGTKHIPKRQVFPTEEQGLDGESETVLRNLAINYLMKSWKQ